MLTSTAEIILGCERNMHVVCEMHDNWHVQYISSSRNVNLFSRDFRKTYANRRGCRMKDIPFMRSLFFQFEFETSANEPRQTNHEKGCRMKRQSFFTTSPDAVKMIKWIGN